MDKLILRNNLLMERSKVKNRSQKESNIFKKLETIINNNSLVVAGYLSVKSEVNLSLFLNFLLKKTAESSKFPKNTCTFLLRLVTNDSEVASMTFYGVKDSLGRNLEKHLLFSWQPKAWSENVV